MKSNQFIIDRLIIDPKFNRFLEKCFKKFLKGNWGCISEKDKLINDHELQNNNVFGIIGIYKHRDYGGYMLTIKPDDNNLYIEALSIDNYKIIELKRF